MLLVKIRVFILSGGKYLYDCYVLKRRGDTCYK